MSVTRLLTIHLKAERHLVDARARARQIAALLRLDAQDQVRIATVTSELVRNALRYAGGGRVEFALDSGTEPRLLTVRVSDRGPGIPDLDGVLNGTYTSPTGLGVGLTGSRRLMDTFQVESGPDGTTVTVGKRLPPGLTRPDVLATAEALARVQPSGANSELWVQNQELLDMLATLAEREERLRSLNRELEDTNRGVVALYAELEEQADRLREANALKTKFLSYMSHEFRTPLNSILGLTRILLAGLDGDLTEEQRKQVELIKGASGDLLEMVNDLLDLAKVEAGRTDVVVTTFEVSQLFATLRAMFLPLVTTPDVRLVFDDASALPRLRTDEGKVSQILRNYIANALKFTTRGEVRVSATLDEGGQSVRFWVHDTGIGIPATELPRLFQDYAQVTTPLQNTPKGTGLGLSITRRFAELLGGRVGVRSTPEVGSSFFADIPVVVPGAAPEGAPEPAPDATPPPSRPRVLLVDDNEADRYLLSTLLAREHFGVETATDALEGLVRARSEAWHAVLLDLNLPDRSGTEVLRLMRASPETRHLPVLIVTSQLLDAGTREAIEALGASVHAKARLYQGDGSDLVTALWRAVRQRGG